MNIGLILIRCGATLYKMMTYCIRLCVSNKSHLRKSLSTTSYVFSKLKCSLFAQEILKCNDHKLWTEGMKIFDFSGSTTAKALWKAHLSIQCSVWVAIALTYTDLSKWHIKDTVEIIITTLLSTLAGLTNTMHFVRKQRERNDLQHMFRGQNRTGDAPLCSMHCDHKAMQVLRKINLTHF